MDCSLPGSSIHVIFQARILEWGCHFLLQGIWEMEPGSPSLPTDTLLSELLGKPWSHHYWSCHFMANRWGNKGNSDQPLFSWAPKSLQTVSAAMKFKRHLLLGRKAVTNLDSVLETRNITLLTKVRLVKAMVFPVVMYGWESWTIKKAGRRRIDAFELWCWRKLLRVPWTARKSNQSILKEINPKSSLGGLMLKLKLQYFGHLM